MEFIKQLLVVSPNTEQEDLKVIREVIETNNFKDYVFEPFEECAMTEYVMIPQEAQTIRNTNLAEVNWSIQVSLQLPSLFIRFDITVY